MEEGKTADPEKDENDCQDEEHISCFPKLEIFRPVRGSGNLPVEARRNVKFTFRESLGFAGTLLQKENLAVFLQILPLVTSICGHPASARDGWDQHHFIAVSELAGVATKKADVFFVHVDVDELS